MTPLFYLFRGALPALRRLATTVAIVITGMGGMPANGSALQADTVRVLAYNIHHGGGMDSILDLDRIAALIRDVDPDLVALQEVDSVTERTLRVDQAEYLGRLTGLTPVFGSFMPYQGGSYGMAVLSRLPIERSENLRLPDGDEPRTSVMAVVRLPNSGAALRFVGVHFYRTEVERSAQAVRLEQHLAAESLPTVLAGDFNSLPGSRVMDELARSWQIVDKGDDNFTFPSWEPAREIDFILLQPRAAFEVLRHQTLDEPIASDHRPIVIDLVVRGSGR